MAIVTGAESLTLNIAYGDEVWTQEFKYAQYMNEIVAAAMEHFGLPAEDARKYSLFAGEERQPNVMMIYDSRSINDGDTLVLKLK